MNEKEILPLAEQWLRLLTLNERKNAELFTTYLSQPYQEYSDTHESDVSGRYGVRRYC